MFRIRFHGRGGQGMKTASHILGKAFFREGYEVQDAPRYGAERRGAPMSSYVRACHSPINERGVVLTPDCIVVADDTLIPIPTAEILKGHGQHTLLLLRSRTSPEHWLDELGLEDGLLCVPDIEKAAESPLLGGMACVGAVAKLTRVIRRKTLENGVLEELCHLDKGKLALNVDVILEAYDKTDNSKTFIREGKNGATPNSAAPKWIELLLDNATKAAPAIYTPLTSKNTQTGLWRSMRPEIDHGVCNRCWWLCSTYCPEGAIEVDDDRFVHIDYDHCKGCLICMNQCPAHAIECFPENSQSHGLKEVSS